jgi:signal transduction histidine kinase
MFNILEDEREAKAGVEKKVEEKTKELTLLNEKLTENWLQLQSSIRSLPLGFILINPDHKIIIANQRIREILEIDRNEELTCERIMQMFFGRVDLLSQCQIASSKKQVIKISEVEFKNKILKMKFIPVLNQSNQVTSTIFLVEDITEDKRLQRARDEFFSIASHELRTPLTAIRGNTSMILDYYKEEIKDENLKQMLFDIHNASLRLIDIINDFLNLSRLEMGKIVFKNENFDLKVLVDEVIEELLPVAKNKGLYLQAESEFPSLLVLADKERTREVLVNLVGNALKFTQKGGVKVVLKKEGNYAQVLVEDTGFGISEKNRNLLFRKFQQASDSILTRDVTQGTGLGLYISKLIIENMKGEIGLLRSEVGKGSTFYFKLPLVLTN